MQRYCKYLILLLSGLTFSLTAMASVEKLLSTEESLVDTTIVVDRVQVSAVKQGMVLRSEPIAATIVGERTVARRQISALKHLADMVPNLHIPDYGSRMTSSVYVRGLGARIDQPAVGMTVDNVPLMQKNSFDMELMDIERIEVLRGPQSTLYGRNTMGGVVNIYTLSPFNYQGSRIKAEYSSGNTRRFHASIYEKFGERFATSVSAHSLASDGLFRNALTGKKCDWEEFEGGNWKLQFRNNKGLRIENTLAYSDGKQGGYPYAFIGGRSEGEPGVKIGQIAYNDRCGYERLTITDGLTIQYEQPRYSITSITSYQYTNDQMTMDNDFLPLDYFTLRQGIREQVITEDLLFRSRGDRAYNYLFGFYGFYRYNHMNAPVHFKEEGINEMIFAAANTASGGRVQLTALQPMPLHSDFENPNYGGALYHESAWRFGRFEAKAGLRIESEQTELRHYNWGSLQFHQKVSMPQMPFPVEKDSAVEIEESGKLKKAYTELLPKFSLIYRFDAQRNLYLSVSRGFKAGGFNTQLFSDILKEQLQSKAMGSEYAMKDIVSYKPEYSWNYEFGGHFSCAEGLVRGDMALFLIQVEDQQLTTFPDANSTGRMMTNAGRTRSMGGEVALQIHPSRNFEIDLAYGYTHATFRRYNDGKSDFEGNYLPYVPRQTLSTGITWTIPTGVAWLGDLVLHGGLRSAGKIYWDEANTLEQPFYTLFDGSIRIEHARYAIDFWGKNLAEKQYDLFYFESIGNRFVQRGKPRILGITLSINFY
ncbi:MAG: TonB-dependent receptor [Alistipes sp.]|nr:TonB-dependent receptor [Alistipes sp.]